MPNLSGKTVAFLATDGFEESELAQPRKTLDDAGATTHIVSPKEGTIKAWDEDDWGGSYSVDKTLYAADPSDYDLLVLPGGQINPDKLRLEDAAVRFVKAFAEAGKPIGAICHGPWLLVEADLVRGKRVTSFPSIKTDLVNAGANWVDEEVVQDGQFVTSRKPDDIPAFSDALVRRLQAMPS
jgi:protease I